MYHSIKPLSDKKFTEKFNIACGILEDLCKQSHSDGEEDEGEAFPDHLVPIIRSYLNIKDEEEGVSIRKLNAKQKEQVRNQNMHYQALLLNGNQLPVGNVDDAPTNERLTCQDGNRRVGFETVNRGYALNNPVSAEHMSEVGKGSSRKRKGGTNTGKTKPKTDASTIIQNSTEMHNETLKSLKTIAKRFEVDDDDDDGGDRGNNSKSLKKQKFDLKERMYNEKMTLEEKKEERAAARDAIEIKRIRFEYSKLRLAQYQELRREARQDMKDFKNDDKEAYDEARKSYLYYGKLIEQVTTETETNQSDTIHEREA